MVKRGQDMFNIPDRYRNEVDILIKDFIPTDLNVKDKKRIKDIVKKVRLTYQIAGEEICSVVDENYRCQVIQFYDMEIDSIKNAAFLATTYQGIIKPYCVLHIYDTTSEVYSLAVKRLNQNDDTQIVIEDSILTQAYMRHLPDTARDRLFEYLDYEQTKNKTDKVSLYKEWFYKAYMLQNEKDYAKTQTILDANSWYDSNNTERIYSYFKKIVETRKALKKANTNAERMSVNKEIKKALEVLDGEIRV